MASGNNSGHLYELSSSWRTKHFGVRYETNLPGRRASSRSHVMVPGPHGLAPLNGFSPRSILETCGFVFRWLVEVPRDTLKRDPHDVQAYRGSTYRNAWGRSMGAFQDDAGEHNRILMRLGQAAVAAESLERFEYRIIDGHPFVWVLHPGLAGGAMVLGYEHLLFLDHLGYLQIQPESLLPAGGFILTPAGLARCGEMDLFQALWGMEAAVGAPDSPQSRATDQI